MSRPDPHSYADDTQPSTTRLTWKARVDFAERRLHGEALLKLDSPRGGPLDLDTRDLEIQAVETEDGKPVPHAMHAPMPILGSRLRAELPQGAAAVRIRYRTKPQASALQWLSPAQTAGGKHPFLFSQCQAIHARSVVPLQDTPRIRIVYDAQLTVPAALRGLMAAAHVGRDARGEEAVERYEMPQPIPPYLLALAVGELESRELGPRSRVWAEPSLVEAAAREFAQVDQMILAAEKLFGPYDWDRFDVLAMPPSFPYGGMENPRLTFLTPTVIAGDRSLVNVLAHELAHSWTGNLVTNANAEHFWLNEGFTVFVERRILEALEGAESTALHAAVGRRSLDEAMGQFASAPQLTRLVTQLSGVDPDEAFSQVPYEKGYLFLRALEDAAGRDRFDAFLRAYVTRFRFQSITTADFLELLEKTLPGLAEKVNAQAWLHGEGIPAGAPQPRSRRLDDVRALAGKMPPPEQARAWTPLEWVLYLEATEHPAPPELTAELDRRYQLTGSGNYEVLVSWLQLAVRSGHAPALARTEEVLGAVGRMKYLKPLYRALLCSPDSTQLAHRCFERYRDRYHPIAQQVIEGLLRSGR
ncbi:MAG TPA: M1 family metallopeptidase [Myxococcales bacterium]|nr:M1 family metallopeptidase [Myxococcales bacterium]